MHLSDPSRDVVSKGSTTSGSLSSEAGRTHDCDCYCGGWSSMGGLAEHSLRSRVVRVDSTTARVIGFPGDQLAQTQSGSLLFGGMWMVPLSWNVVRLGPR